MPSHERLRLAFVASQDLRVRSNGVNSHSRNLLAGLAALGAAPVAICHPAASAQGRARLFAARVRGRMGAGADRRALADLQTRRAILADAVRAAMADGGVDVVHAQDFVAASAVWLALGEKAPPVVLAHHVNGLAADELMQRFGLGPEAAAVTWTQRESAKALQHAARVVAVSPWAAEVLRERAGLMAGRVGVVENGVRVPAEPPPPGGEAGLVVAVGQVVARKGFDVLVEAARQIAVAGALPGFHAAVLGDGPERAALAQGAATPPTAPVRFAGATDEVGAWLSRAQAFCLPSRAENLPMALLEAMAAALPVVASDVGGIAAVVGRGPDRAGWLVPPGDSAALSAALTELLGDGARAREMGLRGYARVRAHHSLEAMASAWLDVYRDARA